MNRLFEIVYLLLERRRMTAKELAEHFEVSARTIYRDIEALSAAGIPIYAMKGRSGGICLMENFVLSKSLLSEAEQRDLLAALRSVSAVSYRNAEGMISKLAGLFKRDDTDWIEVDFSGWGGDGVEQFNALKSAILDGKVISFDYYNARGELANRCVEPVKCWFKSKSWYLYGYCRGKRHMRMFKLSRMKHLRITDELFDKKDHAGLERLESPDSSGAPHMNIKLKIDKAMAYRVFDEFCEREITGTDETGNFIINIDYGEDEWVYGFILSFGHYAEVLEPQHIRGILAERLKMAMNIYECVE